MSSQTRRLPVSGYAFSGLRDLPRSAPGVGLAVLVGLSAFAFSLLYLLTDVIELIQDGFSTWQLALTYAAEAAIPLFVLGLYAAQRPRIGSLGLVSALLYAYVYVFFTATVVYALVRNTSDFDALNDEFGAWMTIHGALMVLAGIGFGLAVVRARTLPRWTGLTLMVGVVFVAAASGLSDPVQTVAAATRDLAFAGMGLALCAPRQERQPGTNRPITGASLLTRARRQTSTLDPGASSGSSMCEARPVRPGWESGRGRAR